MTAACTNPNCGITLAPGAERCWLCGTAVEQPCDVEAEEAWLRLKTGKFGKRGEVLPETKKARKRT